MKRLITTIVLSATTFALPVLASAPVVAPTKTAEGETCTSGYILVQDVCASVGSFGDMDRLVDAILSFKDPEYAARKKKLEELEKQQRVFVQEKSKGNPRVVPLPLSGYIYSRDGNFVACTGEYGSWQTAKNNVCAGGRYSSWHTHKDSVACGGQYSSWHTHRDSVCAGGQYSSWHTHRDEVACGGRYSSWHTHRESVCAGGMYSSYHAHRERVACGGQYDGWQDSRDGTDVCVGGKFDGCVHSRDGSKVACGGWAHIYRGE